MRDTEYWIGVEKEAEERLQDKQTRLDSLDVERAEIINEIADLEKLLKSVKPFTTERALDVVSRIVDNFVSVDPDSGLADACRHVLRIAGKYHTPKQVRDILSSSTNYDLSKHPNPLASIHGILKRFAESGEAASVTKEGTTSFKIEPKWHKALKEAGGIALTSPPFAKQKRALTVREARRLQGFEGKKKS